MTTCIKHLRWWPCLGKHQRYDGEPCETTESRRAEIVVQEFHGGLLNVDEAHKVLKKIRKTESVDQRTQTRVES